MGKHSVISPSVELHKNAGAAAPDIPVRIQMNPAALTVSAREIDLVLSFLDDIVLEMQRLQLQSESL